MSAILLNHPVVKMKLKKSRKPRVSKKEKSEDADLSLTIEHYKDFEDKKTAAENTKDKNKKKKGKQKNKTVKDKKSGGKKTAAANKKER